MSTGQITLGIGPGGTIPLFLTFGLGLGAEALAGSVVELADAAAYAVALSNSAAYAVALGDSAAYNVEITEELL